MPIITSMLPVLHTAAKSTVHDSARNSNVNRDKPDIFLTFGKLHSLHLYWHFNLNCVRFLLHSCFKQCEKYPYCFREISSKGEVQTLAPYKATL
jgi:hypothetical protein